MPAQSARHPPERSRELSHCFSPVPMPARFKCDFSGSMSDTPPAASRAVCWTARGQKGAPCPTRMWSIRMWSIRMWSTRIAGNKKRRTRRREKPGMAGGERLGKTPCRAIYKGNLLTAACLLVTAYKHETVAFVCKYYVYQRPGSGFLEPPAVLFFRLAQ